LLLLVTKRRKMKKKNLIDQPLTEMQRKFANLYVENLGANKLTNTQLAINAGYAPESAYQRAYEMLDARHCPHVVRFIAERKAEFYKRNNIDPQKHMARLNHLGLKAEENKMFGIAGQMEIARGKVAGYYVERVLNRNVEEDSAEELEKKMKKILEENKLFLEHDKKDKKEKNN